ncbi:hypothetical protein J2Z76_000145 [Sedimentibacter acidaminivorans]|uniref:Uncharacterized protein n=1 Tax=Sedimentibacter acidaminivorans TaxID=913099 RepID=A0ABS4G9D2_9FIRM|nr:hypothetical protein [Sedimentibacter acidaminivorans]
MFLTIKTATEIGRCFYVSDLGISAVFGCGNATLRLKTGDRVIVDLIDYVAEIIEKIYDKIDLSVTDFFERIREVGVIKYNIMKKTPQAFDFINALGKEESAEVKLDINKKVKSIVENGFARIYENIDFSKFRNDIDLEKTLNIINWTMLSFSEQQRYRLNSFKDIEVEILKEWDDYFDIMKRCFYK